MKKKLIIYNVVMALVVLALMLGMGVLVTSSNNTEMTEAKIKDITAVYVANYSEDIVLTADDDVRVTVIDSDGTVLKDSSLSAEEAASLENHLSREEVIAAIEGTPKVVTRYSSTLKRDMMYYAEKVSLEGGGCVYIRVAIPTESVNGYLLKSLVPLIFILLAVWICSIIASVLLSGQLLKPLQQVRDGLAQIEGGFYHKITPSSDDEELNGILSGINDLSERLQTTIVNAEAQQRRLNYILANVTDGIAVFDSELTVTVANSSLKAIFGVNEPEGKRIEVLTADKTLISAIEDCARKKADVIFQTENAGRYFACTARYTDSDLIILVMCDITQDKQSENMRLEFFANASHELKTPLTAVKGFNDMITMQSKEDFTLKYSARIDKEIDRLISLLNDMLDLSKLENSKLSNLTLVPVNMREVADEIAEELKPLSESKKVTLTVSGEAIVSAEREHIYELIKNLAENGVRYNSANGTVKIELSSSGGKQKLVVSDDGIGIDASQQTRIFERFYRVNKSRSRATGGTGLGLAIVKHVCELYNASISLESRLGAGTEITVIFG